MASQMKSTEYQNKTNVTTIEQFKKQTNLVCILRIPLFLLKLDVITRPEFKIESLVFMDSY
jgi:hypothetical protein